MTPDVARLQRRARELLPSEVYDYYAGGSGRERTLRANKKAWRRVWMAPRVLRDVSVVDTTTRLLGARLATPVGVAPTAFHRMAHAEEELWWRGGRPRVAGGLTDDLAHVMALAGAASLAEIPAAVVVGPGQLPSGRPGWAH